MRIFAHFTRTEDATGKKSAVTKNKKQNMQQPKKLEKITHLQQEHQQTNPSQYRCLQDKPMQQPRPKRKKLKTKHKNTKK